jgi:hypothetical protein
VKIRFASCLLLLTASLWARSHNHPAKADVPPDPDYVFALGAVNHVLHAWQTGDVEDGMVQLSDGIRRSHNADNLEQFFSNGNDNGKDRSFEIARGHGHSGLYSFPVVLVTLRGNHVTRKSSENNCGGDWQERLGGR